MPAATPPSTEPVNPCEPQFRAAAQPTHPTLIPTRTAKKFKIFTRPLDNQPFGSYNYTDISKAGGKRNMEKGNTKQKILDAALDLFSIQGYEATSISQIADSVGIRKASMYSHFGSKKEILDALVETTLEQYDRHSIFTRADWDDPDFTKDKHDITPDSALRMIVGQMRYILHDPQISKSRKMLTIEQFRNPKLKALQTKQNYTDVMRYFTGLVGFLIRRGKLIRDDPEIMAAQLCLPISVWINLCDREPIREEEVIGLIERHVKQFFEMYAPSNSESLGENDAP